MIFKLFLLFDDLLVAFQWERGVRDAVDPAGGLGEGRRWIEQVVGKRCGPLEKAHKQSKRSLPEALGHCAHVPGLGHDEAFYKWN